ncbi:hypothetical protein V2J09_007607 [Rumex salicifolius]
MADESNISLPKPPGRRKSRPSRPGAFSEYDKVGRVGGGRPNKAKIIWAVALLLLLIVLCTLGIVWWVALRDSDAPTVRVQRLAVPRFEVDSDFVEEQVVLSADFDFYLHSTNKNSMTSSRLESMVMEVNWKEYGVQLGQSSVDTVGQLGSGGSRLMQVRAHGESSIPTKNKVRGLKMEELKLDIALSGNVVFSLGPLSSKSYAFTVTCAAVTAASKDIPCTSKLYSSLKNTPSSPEKAPASPASPSNVNQEQSSSSSSTPTLAEPAQASTDSEQAPTSEISLPPSAGPAEAPTAPRSGPRVKITTSDKSVTLDNGIVGVIISKPDGHVIGISYNGVDNILDVVNPEDDRGLKCTTFRVIVDSEDQVEVSFSRNYDPTAKNSKVVPMDIDLRYILMRGESGLYSYGIFERQKWPGCTIPNLRLAFKLHRTKFRNLVVADDRRRKMPLPEDRLKGRGEQLAYPEAITPSYEFRAGGPNKQFLTSHVGPSMFVSAHYSGENVIPKFDDNEPWKKVLGPVFMYLNRVEKGQNASLLWQDAKNKMQEEADSWPYNFPASDDFLNTFQRANVTGRFFVHDRFVDNKNRPANNSLVGLAVPGDSGSWQLECKGYQFWTNTDSEGRFTINNVRPGIYNLFGYVPGVLGDFKRNGTINVTIGHNLDLGEVVYEPPRDGETLWEIGEPDRTAKEFFIPDPDKEYVNKLYVDHPDKFRQYGLWERYTEIYPQKDLTYNVKESDYKKDWFFAQIRANSEKGDPIFTVGEMGSDNAIARHGIHGIYRLFNVDIKGSKLDKGSNTIYLKQTKSSSPFQGIMYDYIRLEAPSNDAPKR